MSLPKLPDAKLIESVVGSYRVETPEGTIAFSLERRGTFLHAVGDRVGLALPWGGRLVVVFGPLNKTEIGAYLVTPRQVTGLWVPPGADQPDYSACGLELSTPGTDGMWRISKAYAIDKSVYAGKVERDPMHGTDANATPRAVHMLWRLDDGEFRSFALDYGDALYSTFCFEPEKPHGLAVYDLKTLKGTSLTSTGRGPQAETLVRV